MTYSEGERDVFVIHPAKGELSLIPEKRTYQVELTGFSQEAAQKAEVRLGGQLLTGQQAAVAYKRETRAVEVTVKDVDITGCLEISVDSGSRTDDNRVEERIFQFLNQAEIAFDLKDRIYRLVQNGKRVPVLLAELHAMEIDRELYGALEEILTA